MLLGGNKGMPTIPSLNQIHFVRFCRFLGHSLTDKLYKFPKTKDIDQEIEF